LKRHQADALLERHLFAPGAAHQQDAQQLAFASQQGDGAKRFGAQRIS